jgi:hypothetical protein
VAGIGWSITALPHTSWPLYDTPRGFRLGVRPGPGRGFIRGARPSPGDGGRRAAGSDGRSRGEGRGSRRGAR